VTAPLVFTPSIQAALLLSHHLPVEISLINVVQKGEDLLLDATKQSYFVLEPNWLINVTTLTQLDYCKRTYLNERFSIRKTNRFLIKGSVIHAVFEDILKNHTDHDALRKKMSDVLNSYALEFAFLNLNIQELENEIREHLNRLYLYRKQKLQKIKTIFTERYLIDNKVGLKGKIDAVVEYEDGSLQALELKTGKGWGAFAKRGHAFQAQAYSLMLQMKFPEKRILAPVIIYSGEDKKAEFLTRRVAMSYADTVNLMNMRNELIAADLTGRLDFQRDHRRCSKCSNRTGCEFLLELCYGEDQNSNLFNTYVKAMLEEYGLIKRTQGRYFNINAHMRIEQGRCLKINDIKKGSNINELVLLCENHSEFREGDRCLLSDKDGPLGPHCIEGVLVHVEHDRVVLQLSQPVTELWFQPEYLDLHLSETLFEINFAGIMELFKNPNLQDIREILIHGHGEGLYLKAASMPLPTDTSKGIEGHHYALDGLSQSQRHALLHSLEDDRHLLVQGPPGTGKTYTIARMIHALHKAGKRIMVACFTHRAVEEVCLKLMTAAPELEFYCLSSTSENTLLHSHDLERVIACHSTVHGRVEAIKVLVNRNPVFIATTHAWLSGRYDALADKEPFDVAIVDEAGQLLLPQTIGAVRLARRFILVGDHKQLPPVVQSQNACLLQKTLFELLMDLGTSEIDKIMLCEQFRMPKEVADLVSKTFYEGRLVSHPSCSGSGANEPKFGQAQQAVMYGSCYEGVGHMPLVLIDVPSPSGPPYKTDKQNPNEVNAIIRVLKALDLNLKYLIDDLKKPPLGIIAPFRAQVAAIRKAIQKQFNDCLDHQPFAIRAMVDTVDRFQGDERDLILLSLCILTGDIPDLYSDAKRLNVAVSRAKKQLIAIGDWRLAETVPVLADFKKNALKQQGSLYIDRKTWYSPHVHGMAELGGGIMHSKGMGEKIW